MDGYKDGDRRRSDALEVTRPLVRGSRGPLRKTPPATCHAALIGNCQCELATLSHWQHSQPPALRPIKIKISRKSLYNATKFHTLLEVSPLKFLVAKRIRQQATSQSSAPVQQPVSHLTEIWIGYILAFSGIAQSLPRRWPYS